MTLEASVSQFNKKTYHCHAGANKSENVTELGGAKLKVSVVAAPPSVEKTLPLTSTDTGHIFVALLRCFAGIFRPRARATGYLNRLFISLYKAGN